MNNKIMRRKQHLKEKKKKLARLNIKNQLKKNGRKNNKKSTANRKITTITRNACEINLL